MGDEGAGEPFVGIVADGATDYEGVLPSDTVSLSDSDSEDFGFPGEAEVDTISPEEPLPSDDVGCGSDESGDPLPSKRKLPVQPFHLKGMSSSFSQRSQNIFDCLEGAAKQAVPSMAEDNVIDGRFKRPLPPPSLSSKMPAESLGRQSRPPPLRKNSPAVPDYVAHPERWTKYSLEDVSESSDKTNRSIAMEFLEGLKSRREQSSAGPESYTPSFNQDPSSSGAGRIVFTKPTKSGLEASERKRTAVKDDEEAKIIDASQEFKGKPQKRSYTQNEDEKIGLDHLDGGIKEGEGRKQLKLEELGVERGPSTDLAEAHEETVVVTVGFHGSKKRSRKHFRPRISHEEEEEES
ncbi:protein TSSC4-like [Hemicordylus capensis]|uniref:protein TSSC4-like n=1 Tax=Hemicordylus capensis TaxID=884348 RepID=UPI00230356A0|nr:protein TSSC4-like [Hemicordylus capensis]XP_053150111.1 protein TSSC4-like [Hemicordylus capensis]XP_053150112.1 protein TSSC4-like [Hemicordylus capensis]XP_053150113.1 protein TSSC4-like [Hemicordylus capensis]XP_053150114.1 protein TSSC4-like [Hemicordylus capensis]XP_053150115.1 protein TSSC4-like [Hemicordylus capensis]XP_053150116.1 protein TSSC4-like [Hemicordylus capensis]XP_053150117.1 protein TSSC4-like [Hemicordylus capensis]XP_053150119.1 protein TSSC4-like [Hemicordylus cap